MEKCYEIRAWLSKVVVPYVRNSDVKEIQCDEAPFIPHITYIETPLGHEVKIVVNDYHYKEYRERIEEIVSKILENEIEPDDIHALAADLDEEYDYIERKHGEELVIIINPGNEDP